MKNYEIIFNANSPYWNTDPEYNRVFLTAQQNYWNHYLQSRGVVFLNQILESLGLPLLSVGQLVGWTTKSNVDFGIPPREECNASIILTLNIEGEVYQEIDRLREGSNAAPQG